MKRLNSIKMRRLLSEGRLKARRGKPPREGMLLSLVHRTDPNGWHYQVEWVHDKRVKPKPYVIVYAFSPPRDFSARSATHYLD